MTEIATYEHHFVTRDKAPGDRDVTFNMIEDESGDTFWGYGHQEPGEFVNEVMRWLQHVGCGPEPGEPHPSGLAEQSVEHLWASADDEHCERFSLAGSEDADAFPVTRPWL